MHADDGGMLQARKNLRDSIVRLTYHLLQDTPAKSDEAPDMCQQLDICFLGRPLQRMLGAIGSAGVARGRSTLQFGALRTATAIRFIRMVTQMLHSSRNHTMQTLGNNEHGSRLATKHSRAETFARCRPLWKWVADS